MRRGEGAGGLNLSARSPHSVRTTRAVAGCFATTAVEKTSDASALRVAGGPIARLSPATRHGLRVAIEHESGTGRSRRWSPGSMISS